MSDVSDRPFPCPGTQAWAAMTKRKHALARKRVLGTITPEERAEYARLQGQTVLALGELECARTRLT